MTAASEPSPIAREEGADVVEQRRFKRLPTLFTGVLEWTGRSTEVVVLDLSMSGAKVRLPKPLIVEPTVTLRVERVSTFDAQVVWQKGNRLGLLFLEDPQTIADRLPPALAAWLGAQ